MKSFYEMTRLVRNFREFTAGPAGPSQGTGGEGGVAAAPQPPQTPANPASQGMGVPSKATVNPIGMNPLEGLSKTLDKLEDDIKYVKEYVQSTGSPAGQISQLEKLYQQMTTLVKGMGSNAEDSIHQQDDQAHKNQSQQNAGPPASAVPGGAQAV